MIGRAFAEKVLDRLSYYNVGKTEDSNIMWAAHLSSIISFLIITVNFLYHVPPPSSSSILGWSNRLQWSADDQSKLNPLVLILVLGCLIISVVLFGYRGNERHDIPMKHFQKFVNSLKSRLTVAQVPHYVTSIISLTFLFLKVYRCKYWKNRGEVR